MAATEETIGQLLRRSRKRRGKTQRDVARELGKTQPTVHAWESDRTLPETRELRAVARAYGIRPTRLLPEVA